MSRDITDDQNAAAGASLVRPVLLIEADFDGGSVNLFNGIGTLPINGVDYTGTGTLLSIDPAQETADLNATAATFTLSGVQSADIALALTEHYQGRAGRMKLALLDDSNALIDDPITIFSGLMDVMTIHDDPAGPVIAMTAENDLIRMNRANARNRTHEDQQTVASGDMFFSFVPAMQNRQIVWG